MLSLAVARIVSLGMHADVEREDGRARCYKMFEGFCTRALARWRDGRAECRAASRSHAADRTTALARRSLFVERRCIVSLNLHADMEREDWRARCYTMIEGFCTRALARWRDGPEGGTVTKDIVDRIVIARPVELSPLLRRSLLSSSGVSPPPSQPT